MTDSRTDRDHRGPAASRTQLAALVFLLVAVLLTLLSPFGWNFLIPHFAEIGRAFLDGAAVIASAVLDFLRWLPGLFL